MGSVNYILGMDVCNSIEVHTVHLYHSQYINNLITFNNMGLYVWQPMYHKATLSMPQSTAKWSTEAAKMKHLPCNELIDSQLWVAIAQD